MHATVIARWLELIQHVAMRRSREDMLLNLLKVLFLSFICIPQVHSQECLQAQGEEGLPLFMDYTNDVGGYPTVRFQQQAIIPTYELVCCGNITEWGVDVHPITGSVPVVYSLDFQVWRPSPTVDDSTGTGCYSLVGNNRFTSIPVNTPTFILSPSPEAYIEFQPGDVVGFYIEEARNNNFDGVVLLDRENFTSELVWYASIAPTMATSRNGDCPYSVGSDGVLDTSVRAAPVISVNIASYSCPTEIQSETESNLESVDGGNSRIAVAVAVPLILTIAVMVTVVASIVVCQIKRAKNTTEKPNNIYADPLQGLEVNEAYETHVVMKSNVAYTTNTELKDNAPSSSNLDLERDETYTSTENLLDPVHGVAVAYATVGELEPYATVVTSTVTKGNGEEHVTREEELVENESYGSAIVMEKNEASKPESSRGAVNEYADYHTYDSI